MEHVASTVPQAVDAVAMTIPMAKALAMAFGVGLPAIALGMVGLSAMNGISRNPEAGQKMFLPFILACAFIEGLGILMYFIGVNAIK